MRTAKVYVREYLAGVLVENDQGYSFEYDTGYLEHGPAEAVSLTLPITTRVHQSNVMFAFFDGLIPEGWLLKVAQRNWKLNERDRMGLLMVCCQDCIGAVSIIGDEV